MAVNYQAILDKLLDRGYEATTRNVQNAMRVATQQGIVATRLQQLTEEADRLAADGLNMAADNPVLAAALDAVEDLATYNRTLISQAAARLQEQGVQAGQTAARQLSLPGISDEALARVGIRWNRADPEAVSQLLRIAQSSQFTDSLKKYGEFVPQTIRDIALRGIVQGRGPIAVARELRANVETIPIHHANQMMRTIQLESYRRATALSYQANREMIVGHRRVAALDGKACLSCISLHGEILRVDDVVTDHRNGRCLLPGQRVRTARGLVQVEQVRVGDMVVTHKGRYRRVVNTFNRDYSGDVYALTSDSHTVTVTPEHPVYTQRGWVEAAALIASDTALTFVSINRRVSKRRIVQPFARRLSSRTASRAARSPLLCHSGSVSTASITSGNAKSILYVSTANCGDGNRSASFSAAKNSISCADMKSGQRSWRVRAAFAALSGVRPLIKLATKLGSLAIWRDTASLADIGTMPARFISFISGLTLMPSSAVNSLYVARSSTYRRFKNGVIGSPIRASSRRIHASDCVFPAGAPTTLRRWSTAILDLFGKRSAISSAVCVDANDAIIASSSGVQGTPAIARSSPQNIATIIQRQLYTGKVYDLEIEEDHSFFAEGIAVHNCTSIAIIRGLEHLSEMETGEQWFNRQSEAERRRIAGPGAFDALQSGKVQLRDFVSRYQDPVYGTMLKNASLSELGIGGRGGGSRVPGSTPPVTTPRAGAMTALFDAHAQNDPAMRGAIDLMNRVHGVEFDGDAIRTRYRDYRGQVDGRYFNHQPSQRVPNAIELRLKADHKRSTFVHETGHALDFMIFGKDKTFASRYASRNELSEWREATLKSKAIDTLLGIKRDKYANYLLEMDEIWARGYTQYIGTRTGDPEILAEIARVRGIDGPWGNAYWSDDDFAPIAEAFDALFRARGWLR